MQCWKFIPAFMFFSVSDNSILFSKYSVCKNEAGFQFTSELEARLI